MKIAIATICPGGRQRDLLEVSRPTWIEYGRQHNLPIIEVVQPPHPEHVFWGKYFLLEMPEFRDYDAVLHLDNDVLVNPNAPLITEGWDPTKVGVVDERPQFPGRDDAFVRDYYSWYEIDLPTALPSPAIFNMGIFLATRAHLPFFRSLYDNWLAKIKTLRGPRTKRSNLKYIADQPHVSLALQVSDMAQVLPPSFNRLWLGWYMEHGALPWRAFLVYAKASSLFQKFSPRLLANAFARPGARTILRGLRDCHFLHVAGSKSPIWLFDHRPPD